MGEMCWKRMRVLAVVAALLVGSRAGAVEINFHVELDGMVAFAPTGGNELDVYLVNEFNNFDTVYEIKHTPYFEVESCDDIAAPRAAIAECQTEWTEDPKLKRVTKRLSLENGYRVVFKVGGAVPMGAVRRESSFSDQIVPIAELSSGNPDIFSIRTDARTGYRKSDQAIVEMKLSGGKIEGIESKLYPWIFRDKQSNVQLLELPKAANAAVWTLSHNDSDLVEVEFWKLDSNPPSGEPERTIGLKKKSGLRVHLSNEPNPEEFCMHFPPNSTVPFHHFTAFYGLSAFARKGGSIADLPQAFIGMQEPACLDAERDPTGKLGRRVDCMMVMFAASE